jgi:hypothetical protein
MMLYTFELTEPQLARVEDYLVSHFDHQHSEYILGVQHHIMDDLVFVIIDCTPETATFIHLIT